jgi:hypothetical protein
MHIEFKTQRFIAGQNNNYKSDAPLKKSAISLSAMIEALSSTLGLYRESDLATYLYSEPR